LSDAVGAAIASGCEDAVTGVEAGLDAEVFPPEFVAVTVYVQLAPSFGTVKVSVVVEPST
jgi:hypothetical protein